MQSQNISTQGIHQTLDLLSKDPAVWQTPWAEFKYILEKQRSVREHQTPELPKLVGSSWNCSACPSTMEMWLESRIKKLNLLPAPLLCWGTLVLEGNHSQQKGQISVWGANWPLMVAALEISRVGFRSNKTGLEQLCKMECVWDQSWYPSFVGQLCLGCAGGSGVSPTPCKWLGIKTQEITVQVCKTVLTALLIVLLDFFSL